LMKAGLKSIEDYGKLEWDGTLLKLLLS